MQEVNSKILTKPIKIIHFISSLSRGGRERQLATIVANSDIQKYCSKIIYFNETQNSYIDEYALTDKLIQIKSKKRFGRLKELYCTIKNENPSIIWTWGNGESVSILLLKPLFKFKFINGSIRHGIRLKKFSHFFRTLILHLSRNVVSNSKVGLKTNNLNRGNVLYNGIDDKFLTPLKDRAKKRQELTGISEDVPLIISVANLVPYKDYYSTISALKLVKEHRSDFYYLILGDGPLRENLETHIEKSGLKDHVRILGNVSNVDEYLKVSDIFIHSSRGEGCSNAILEAMAAGLYIIASDTGGTSEIIYKENSLLFPYKDFNSLANCLQSALNYFEKNSQMRVVPSDYLKKFSIRKMIMDFESIINSVIS